VDGWVSRLTGSEQGLYNSPVPTHLIFEGPELSGKSFLISQIYPLLEQNNFSSPHFLDGCFWFNCDLGFFGTQYGQPLIQKYMEMVNLLQAKPLILEKFHLSDLVYRKQYCQELPDYSAVEKKLLEMNFKVILTTFKDDGAVLQKRLSDRLKLYPHYRRIAKDAAFYIQQQKLYRQVVSQSTLPYLEVTLNHFSPEEYTPVLDWLRLDHD